MRTTVTGEGNQDMMQNGSTAESTLMATCPCCGDVVVSVGATRVGRGRPARGDGQRDLAAWYAFDCPECRRTVRVEAANHLVSVLVCLGAAESTEEAESWRPEGTPRSAAPALTLDDVLDATLALHATDDLVSLVAGR